MATQISLTRPDAATAVPRLVIATMHGKERAIAPIAERFLGMAPIVADGIDTDRFGSFTGEVPRPGHALDAARAKAAASLARHRDADLAIASEGSFGPHPDMPFIALGKELILLVDRRTGHEVVGEHTTVATNFSRQTVASVSAALDFARLVGFPSHGVVLRAHGGQPVKDIADWQALAEACRHLLQMAPPLTIEADMRAHRNPTRMRAIRRAMIDLVRCYRDRCPACAMPGFAEVARLPGLLCRVCGTATALTRTHVHRCASCGQLEERPADRVHADPGQCGYCNP